MDGEVEQTLATLVQRRIHLGVGLWGLDSVTDHTDHVAVHQRTVAPQFRLSAHSAAPVLGRFKLEA